RGSMRRRSRATPPRSPGSRRFATRARPSARSLIRRWSASPSTGRAGSFPVIIASASVRSAPPCAPISARRPKGSTAMYRYDEFDEAIVRDRIAQFRAQVARRLNGSLSEEEFVLIRQMNGLYLQLHAYMLRVAIPYGTLNSRQARQLALIAERYDRGYGHFTTR